MENLYFSTMSFEKMVNFFLPEMVRDNKVHPKYHEFRAVLSTCLIGLPLMLIFPIPIYLMGKSVTGYLINDLLVLSILLSIKFFGHYRIPMTTTALVTYFIIYGWIRDSGFIYSSNVSILHMYLLAGIWADKRYGWLLIFSNLAVFGFIYYQTLHAALPSEMPLIMGGPLYALGMNVLITLFFGGFLAYLQLDQERDRNRIRQLQDRKIEELDQAVKKRTEQLGEMRERIATDFHDQTGNMLSAITRQATLLKSKLTENDAVQPIADSIISNSNGLYASSKDFLWHLNHNSDDPEELFDYLSSYGQHYYNQFDIAFSCSGGRCHPVQLLPAAALNLIYIFKEAMTNVLKHSGASEVSLSMSCTAESATYILQDNGTWKDTDHSSQHYGLENMRRRSAKNNFKFQLLPGERGTSISVEVPVKPIIYN